MSEDDTSRSYFGIQEKYKDISLKEMLLRLYQTDFHEVNSSSHSLKPNFNSKMISIETKGS